MQSKYKTDKVNYHHYANMYDLYLPPLRHHAIKFLEIGMGCKIGGKESDLPSFYTWREYFVHPEAQIWEVRGSEKSPHCTFGGAFAI